MPIKDAVIITSNRDEHVQRQNAAAPAFHFVQHKKIIFPKDVKAGGTWFAAADTGVVAVLLNGAFVKHIAKPPYRKSRGLILVDIIEAQEPHSFFTALDLKDIEPFTIILYQPGSLHELRWDGNDKHEKSLNISGNYIWSSATLYADEIIEKRKNLFEQFTYSIKNITPDSVYHFHADDHNDEENGFVINRQTGMKTFSITQAIVKPGGIQFLHTDLLQQNQFEETMHIHQATTKI